MMEFLTKKVKGIIGIDDIDLDIDPDGDELLLQEKLQATEKTLDEFDETIDRLCFIVESLEMPEDENNGEDQEEGKEYEPEDKPKVDFEGEKKTSDEPLKPDGVKEIPKEDDEISPPPVDNFVAVEMIKEENDEGTREPSDVEDA